MMGKSRIKERKQPIEVANPCIFVFSRHAKYVLGGDSPFDGGMVLTSQQVALSQPEGKGH